MLQRMQLRWIRCTLAILLAVLTARAESLTLLPAKFTLDGPAAEQREADGRVAFDEPPRDLVP